MLWITGVFDEVESYSFSEDIVEQYITVLKNIAKTIYSPVGLLDVGKNVVMAYDSDLMDVAVNG